MGDATALRVAIQLLHMPANARMVRDAPLPTGIPFLLRVAAGEDEALRDAVALTERSVETLQQAARFFIEQALWHPNADSFRVLGADGNAEASDLKRNMHWMMSWLHPDHDKGGERGVFVVRVTNAWNDLKTPERRAQYAAQLAKTLEREEQLRRGYARKMRERSARQPIRKVGLLRRILARISGRTIR